MFLGQYALKFTGHGRVVLPAKIREELGSGSEIILSRGMDYCIWGFDKSEWEKEAVKQLEVSITDEVGRNLRRFIFSGAVKVELDEQGRFVIPQSLLEFAGVEGEVVMIGAGDHFEIWNINRWSEVLTRIGGGYQNG